jgi:hypothetical protein
VTNAKSGLTSGSTDEDDLKGSYGSSRARMHVRGTRTQLEGWRYRLGFHNEVVGCGQWIWQPVPPSLSMDLKRR